MGNGAAKLTACCCRRPLRRRHVAPAAPPDPCADDSLGHSFCYVRPDSLPSAKPDDASEPTTFRSISGAALSANAGSAPLSASLLPDYGAAAAAAAFESSESFASVPLQPVPRGFLSGPLSGPGAGAGFLSGPIDRGFMSGPLDPTLSSGPLRRSFSQGGRRRRAAAAAGAVASMFRSLGRAVSLTKDVAPAVQESVPVPVPATECRSNVEWAHGKAGEDRIHIVVSDEKDWAFLGIYDGFNGPDATDFLVSNLYAATHHELKGLLWDDQSSGDQCNDDVAVRRRRRRGIKPGRKWKQNETDYSRETNHIAVLKALARALRKTEAAYFKAADDRAQESPELALMGSCVLVMLMKGEDVYLLNVGDSRAVLATARNGNGALEQISEELLHDDDDGSGCGLSAVQLTSEHSVSVPEEEQRVRNEHPDDPHAIANDRVKGSLKVTRAFGAGFLKQPKWNEALLQVFRVDYVGDSPYITCNPSLHHHRLRPSDRFLILSSDGLYQYFTNEEAVAQVEMFIATTPDGDPARHLVEEVLFRAADKAGMDFHELIEIPQGDRRRYHDDVSVIVISLEGRIWRSCV